MAGNQQPDGSRKFTWGTVTAVNFNINRQKRAGGSYIATVLNYMDNQGQAKDQAWASQVIDDPRNAGLRAILVDLYSKPGTPITLHQLKQNGFWNVERIDIGHVQGQASQPGPVAMPPQGGPPGAPPGYMGPPPGGVPAPAPAPQVPTGGVPQQFVQQPDNRSDKMRSKEQCIRGEAIQSAATAEIALVHHRGNDYKFDLKRMISNAEVIAKYITDGVAAPVAAPQAQPPVAPPAAPVPAAAPVAPPAPPAYPAAPPPPPAPPPQVAPPPAPPPPSAYAPPAAPQPVAAPPPAPQPAPAPAYAQAPAAAPGAPAVAAAPQAFDDGFGGP